MDIGRAESLPIALTQIPASGTKLEQVLPIFSSYVADLLRLPQKGRIAVGCDADLVVLGASDQIIDVIVLRQWHKRNGQQLIRGTLE